jgi:hypothetical protein
VTRIDPFRRRLANRLVSGASTVLPRSEIEWGRGMSAEVHSIEDDGDALRWALGCLRTASLLRIGSFLTQHTVPRVLLAVYLLTWCVMPAWLTAMILAYRRGDSAELTELASRTNIGDAQLFVALFDASMVPLLVTLLASGTLYLAGSVALAFRRVSGALQLLLTGMIVTWLYWLIGSSFSPESFKPFLGFGWLTSATTWIHGGLIAWLWCARKTQCRTV